MPYSLHSMANTMPPSRVSHKLMWSKLLLSDMLQSADTKWSELYLVLTWSICARYNADNNMSADNNRSGNPDLDPIKFWDPLGRLMERG